MPKRSAEEDIKEFKELNVKRMTSRSDSQINLDVDQEPETVLRSELLEALGGTSKVTRKIHSSLAELWPPILTNGLPIATKEILLKQFTIPDNCILLKAPTLNLELTAVLEESAKNRDKSIQSEQDQLGLGITAINQALTLLLNSDGDVQVVKILSDGCRILTDLHYVQTQVRKQHINRVLNKPFLADIQTRDETLFGKDLPKRIKASKAIKRQLLQINDTMTPSTSSAPIQSAGLRNRYQDNSPSRLQSVNTVLAPGDFDNKQETCRTASTRQQTTTSSEELNRGSYDTLNSLEIASNDQVKLCVDKLLVVRKAEPRATASKYSYTWNPQILFDFIASKPNRELSLKNITKKLVTLLALSTAYTAQTLSLIEINNIIMTPSGIQIDIREVIKNSAANCEQPVLHLAYFKENNAICPATLLIDYISVTSTVRPTSINKLLLTHQRPHKPPTYETINTWIKEVFHKSGIDLKKQRFSLDLLRETAVWSNQSPSLAKFYKLYIYEKTTMPSLLSYPNNL
ncbi:uncharacterized protein LOC125068997 [Vanessa atalanta]|uniref:uncharacterized protein LOC125068997 n=1 Tax=Vanessa atalanta TaxID=42275 RepID=UPI001FCDF753|nr:uncharacterized protein LOC125068997 [Vanessa atalanta]